VLFLCAVILGGSGNKLGVVLGGALVSYIPLRFTSIADYKYLIFGVALVLLMLFRSQGLIGARSHLLTYARTARQRTVEIVRARPRREASAEEVA
jgi:branched-chain amino acid transport system permease protein